MKLIYKGKFDGNADNLPHGEHKPGAVPFKEASDTKELAKIATVFSIIVAVVFGVLFFVRNAKAGLPAMTGNIGTDVCLGSVLSLLTLFPHELLHAVCFRDEVYLYTNLKQGMLFVVGPETMSKQRFIFMSMLPNIVFGFVPYIAGMIFPQLALIGWFGLMGLTMGVGDFYNVYNAATQMPKGAKTYLYKFNSFWYMEE